MGIAKEWMLEKKLEHDVANALGIQPEHLQDYGYEIREDEFRCLVVWEDNVPDGVSAHEEQGEMVSEVEFPPEPDGPDED